MHVLRRVVTIFAHTTDHTMNTLYNSQEHFAVVYQFISLSHAISRFGTISWFYCSFCSSPWGRIALLIYLPKSYKAQFYNDFFIFVFTASWKDIRMCSLLICRDIYCLCDLLHSFSDWLRLGLPVYVYSGFFPCFNATFTHRDYCMVLC